MNPLLVVLPYCVKDATETERLLKWIVELESARTVAPYPREHSILLVADSNVPRATMVSFLDLAKSAFRNGESIIVSVPQNKQVWGTATKIMFENAASQISQCYKLPWLWLEPDCVPIKPGWIDALALEYDRCPKRFMGQIVTAAQMTQGKPHLAGPAIYPANSYAEMVPYLSAGEHFDLAIAPHVLPRATDTKLIHHFWGKQDLAPVFKDKKLLGDPENTLTIAHIRPEAVLWHREKQGTLIELLRNDLLEKITRPRPRKESPLAFANT